MKIRKAGLGDIQDIKSLADSLLITNNTNNKKYGFYEYSLTSEQYKTRLESPLFLVAESQTGLEGFCLAYSSEFIEKLKQKEHELSSDEIFKYLSNLTGSFVYIDQFAIKQLDSLQGGRAAYNLRDVLMQKSRENKIKYTVAVVIHEPWKNIRAEKFHSKSGSNFVQEIKGKRDIVFGIYKEEL